MSSPAQDAFNAAVAHFRAGRAAETLTACGAVLATDPGHAPATELAGLAGANAGDLAAAEVHFRRALVLAPDDALYHHNFGRFLAGAGRWAEAAEEFRAALRRAPSTAWYFDLASACRAQGLVHEQMAACQEALRLNPKLPEAWNNVGGLLLEQGQLDAAIQHFRQALALNPRYVEALTNCGLACLTRGDFGAAIECYRRAIALEPGHARAHHFMGVALEQSNQRAAAIDAYEAAIQLDANNAAPSLNNIGTLLKFDGRPDAAIAAYRRSLRLRPDSAETWSNLGTILMLHARHTEAIDCARKAVALAPDNPVIHGNLLNAMIFDPAQSAATLAEEHRRHDARYAGVARFSHDPDGAPERRLRIGFVSPNFQDHVVGRNILPLFRQRHRAHAEFICYSMVHTADAFTEQFRSLADGWVDIRRLSDDAAAQRIHADRIDILMDLSLHMSGNRLGVFARKPAPVQVTFAGYPGTTGLKAIDYRLTDPHLDPPGQHDDEYTEKSIRLPASFWCYDPLDSAAPVTDLPCLSEGVVTFGCMNNFCKVNERVLGMWAQVLARVPRSRLWILSPEGWHRRMVMDVFVLAGIDADRVGFVVPRPRQEFLQYFTRIDMSLDTLPYNGHTTSLDSLWMGVPVVTLAGETVAGRAGLSQLTNLGLPELITRTPEAYVEAAAALANDAARLAEYRRTLRPRLEQSVLMDAGRWTLGIEAALRDMWRAWCARAVAPG